MKKLKSHFEMHIRFRNGIFLLVLLLFAIILIYHFYPESKVEKNNFTELSEYQKQIDSLKLVSLQSKKNIQKPFNPNFISEYRGYVLGLSSQELNRLFKYREEGKWINSVEDFKNVTGVSDSVLRKISPLFKFPEWITNSKNKDKVEIIENKYTLRSYDQKRDLNIVSSEELEKNVGVPDFIAERIIKYREKLGGFVHDIQLLDVKGLYDFQRKKVLDLYTVKNAKEIKKINLNIATAKELMQVPYFDFEMVISIKDYIVAKGKILDFKELENIEGFPMEKIDRIALYLTLN